MSHRVPSGGTRWDIEISQGVLDGTSRSLRGYSMGHRDLSGGTRWDIEISQGVLDGTSRSLGGYSMGHRAPPGGTRWDIEPPRPGGALGGKLLEHAGQGVRGEPEVVLGGDDRRSEPDRRPVGVL